MLRDILSGKDDQARAVVQVIGRADADVIVLGGIDWDAGGAGLAALNAPLGYPHVFSLAPNRGRPSGLDLDGDGRTEEPEDQTGFARFRGQKGLAVLSRHPVALVRDLSPTPWGQVAGALGPPDERLSGLPISTTAHWHLAVQLPSGPVSLLVWHATAPVFDGPGDRNGRRNHDEAAIWLDALEQEEGPVILAGIANLDPVDGDGRPEALLKLLAHPRITDPEPASSGAVEASRRQGGTNAMHRSPARLDTADWRDDTGGPGNLRVDYLLPSRDMRLLSAGVFWPGSDDPFLSAVETASRHRLVWIDVSVP